MATNTYTLRIDERGRQVLLQALKMVKDAAEQPILEGDQEEETLRQYEELLQLHRGVLYVKPDIDYKSVEEAPASDSTDVSDDGVDEPVVGPESGYVRKPGEPAPGLDS